MLQVVDASAKDELFLYELYITTRVNDFMMLGLDKQQLDALLHMQFEAQQRSYGCKFPQTKQEIIYYGEVKIGRMMTASQRESIHLIDISLLPHFRGKGYGTKLIQKLLRSAVIRNLPVTLHVATGNPAQRLYERCGFYVTGEAPPYIAMKWDNFIKY